MVWVTADFTSEITEARRQWHNIFQVIKEQLNRILYPVRISFGTENKTRRNSLIKEN